MGVNPLSFRLCLVFAIGWFTLLSLFLNGTRAPMEITDKTGSKTSPLD